MEKEVGELNHPAAQSSASASSTNEPWLEHQCHSQAAGDKLVVAGPQPSHSIHGVKLCYYSSFCLFLINVFWL